MDVERRIDRITDQMQIADARSSWIECIDGIDA